MLLLFENCPMNFKTVKKRISCALPAWLLLDSGQNLIGSGRFWWVHVISSTAIQMSKEHLSETLDKFLIVLRQSLLGKPKQRRQLSKDSAQYPLAPTSTAKKDTFQPFDLIAEQSE